MSLTDLNLTDLNFLITFLGYGLLLSGLVFAVWGVYAFGEWLENKIETKRKQEERAWHKISNYIL